MSILSCSKNNKYTSCVSFCIHSYYLEPNQLEGLHQWIKPNLQLYKNTLWINHLNYTSSRLSAIINISSFQMKWWQHTAMHILSRFAHLLNFIICPKPRQSVLDTKVPNNSKHQSEHKLHGCDFITFLWHFLWKINFINLKISM